MTTTARIYVASLSDYNAGDLHGVWIDIDQDAESIMEEIKTMLGNSRQPNAEEWAIHDHDLPGGLKLSEYESIERVAALGQALDQAADAEAFAAWYTITDDAELADKDADDLLSSFQDEYMGSGDTFKDWIVSNDVDMLGLEQLKSFIAEAEGSHYFPGVSKNPMSDLFEKLTYAIDWDQVARDNEADFTTARVNGTVYVFRTT